jgi:hypothetical protein
MHIVTYKSLCNMKKISLQNEKEKNAFVLKFFLFHQLSRMAEHKHVW